VSIVEALRLHLLAKLPRSMREQLGCILSQYQSHILNLHCPDAISPEQLWRTLDRLGFGTKRTESGIRITLHDDLDISTLDSFARSLLEAMGEPISESA
jgi:hypothetical protein